MIPIASLWLPILLSAVGVFIASSIIHMVFNYHKWEYAQVPDEDGLMASMREIGVEPGTYFFPRAENYKDLALPEMQEKFKTGPVGFMTIVPSGIPTMGKQLVQWFVYTIVVGACVAYLASRTMDPGTSYLAVFRVVGTTAFLAYGFAHVSDSIWKAQTWATSGRYLLDALIYGCVTGGFFGWLWPAA
jgi:hypothetical protein